MSYDLSRVVAELMLEPEELLEVYQSFFRETRQNLVNCHKALATANHDTLPGIFHSIKGSALNLRMTELAELLLEMENLYNKGNLREVAQRIPDLEQKVRSIESSVIRYYSANFFSGYENCPNEYDRSSN
ncbi:MAG: Hpt domain-containing protein [Bacillota bacterium]|jgi:HPt (histidine-containing phosphotransfer) domain-containing protein